MSDRAQRIRIRILTHEETRFWHSRFNRHYRETHQLRIVAECEEDARTSGFAGYAVYDAYENLVAHGSIRSVA